MTGPPDSSRNRATHWRILRQAEVDVPPPPHTQGATAASGFYNLSRGVQLFTQPAMGLLLVASGTFAVALHVGALMAILSAVVIWFVPAAEADSGQQSRPPSE